MLEDLGSEPQVDTAAPITMLITDSTHYIGHIPVDVYARAGEGVDISGASTENVAGQFVLQSR